MYYFIDVRTHINIIISCREFYQRQGTDAKVYRATIEDLPENTRIFYKFLKYSITSSYSNNVYLEWEHLDHSHFPLDNRHNTNRVVTVENGKLMTFIFKFVSNLFFLYSINFHLSTYSTAV